MHLFTEEKDAEIREKESFNETNKSEDLIQISIEEEVKSPEATAHDLELEKVQYVYKFVSLSSSVPSLLLN